MSDPTMPDRDAMVCAQHRCRTPTAKLADIDTTTDPDHVLGRCKSCDAWTGIPRPTPNHGNRGAELRTMLAYFVGGFIAGLIGGTNPTDPPKPGPTRDGPPDGVPWSNTP